MKITTIIEEAARLGASDVHLKPGRRAAIRVDGEMCSLGSDTPPLSDEDLLGFLDHFLADPERRRLEESYELDLARDISVSNALLRLRINIHRQRTGWGIVIRILSDRIPGFDDLDLEPAVRELARLPRGLVLVTEPTFLEMTTELLELKGHTVFSFTRPVDAITHSNEDRLRPDVLVADMQMPGMDGLELIRQIRQQDPDIVAVIATAHSNIENAIDTIRAGAFDFICKPFAVETFELVIDRAVKHRRVLVENRKYQETMMELVEKRGAALTETTRLLEKSYQFMLESMVALVEAREPQTGEHTKRVMEMSVILARHMGLGKAECETIRRGASLHDVGKIAIPDRILLKAGPLDPDEWEIMKSHVEIGYNLLSSNSYLEEVAELVHSHHEHFDGNGYPRGLRGDQICLGARIFSVVDAYDAIRSTRPYSASCSARDALEEIVRCSGRQFDPQVVACMERHHHDVEQAWWKGATENDRKSTRDLTSPMEK